MSLSAVPQRVVSLVPSQTELLLDLGLGDRLVGRTRFCIHPSEQVKDIQVVGGTKKVRIDTVRDLEPDLIIGNKEENKKETILALREKYPVWLSDINTVGKACEMITAMGELFHLRDQAAELVHDIKLHQIEERKPIPVAYFIWQNPYMLAGNDTYIHDMLKINGFRNIVTRSRYPEMTMDEVNAAAPRYIMLSSEPFPFSHKHIDKIQAETQAEVVLVDGEMFSWYGSRILKGIAYAQSLYAKLIQRL